MQHAPTDTALRPLIERRNAVLGRLRLREGGPIGVPPAAPDKEVTPFGFYAWHFKHVASVADLAKLCLLAELDLVKREGIDGTAILASMYVDQPPAVVAALEGCSEIHVRRQRQRAGLDGTTGRPRKGALG